MTDPLIIDPSDLVDSTPPPAYISQETFTLTAPIQLVQLTDEISAALHETVLLAVSGPAEGDLATIAAGNTAVLSVTPGGVSATVVQQVIDAHVPVSDYDVPLAEREFAKVFAKVSGDQTAVLGPDEIQSALRGLVLRSATRPNSAP